MPAFPVLLYNTNATMASQTLFRRHRNRDAVDPSPSSGGGGGGGVSGGSESPASEQQQHHVGTSEIRDVESNRNSNETSPAHSDANDNNNDNVNDAFNNESSPPTTTTTNDEDDDDDVQEIVVQIPNGHPDNPNTNAGTGLSPNFLNLPTVAWEPSEEATALRRDAILREVERVQRANFVHFLVLCLVPTTLLLIVIAAIVSEDGECSGDVYGGGGGDSDNDNALTVCEREPRSFVNAFTSRCICDAVKSVVGEGGLSLGGEGDGGGGGV